MAFYEVRLPEKISHTITVETIGSTDVIESGSGYRQTNSLWDNTLERFILNFQRPKEEMDRIRSFFFCMRSMSNQFRIRHPHDYKLTDNHNVECPVLDNDDVQVDFQIIKKYQYAGLPVYERTIKKPVHGGNPHGEHDTVQVFFNDIKQTSGWTVDSTTGIITLDTAQPGVAVSVQCEYDFPVMFDMDFMKQNHMGPFARSWNQLALLEVRL